jgi:DNA helicase-2/ATP-dependent DNA helicase PcrA
MQLNPAQREAVTTLAGPLLVLAGAGTGKTRVVTFRIAELIRRGTPPERILAVTFTKKAAGEMLERTTALLGRKLQEKPHISTFHALCVQVLRRHIAQLGYPPSFAIYDRSDQESLARAALREIKVATDSMRPGDLLATISRWKSAGLRPPQAEAAAENDKQHLAAAAYRRYQTALKARGAVDFDDLLLLTEELFARFTEARAAEAGRFSQLLIDEYQDTNAAQYRIVKALARDHRNLCVVGDDDQSIYGWRGAEVSHILRFQRDWPEAKVVRLEENYRSTGPILAMANRLIAFNRLRHVKVLRAMRSGGNRPRILQFDTEADEARGVATEIHSQLTSHQAAAGDFVILFRTNEQTRPFESELRRIGVPYVVIGGMSFFDRKEVRDILAYLKLAAHAGDDVSLLRIINVPPRGIGASTVTKLTRRAVAEKRPLWQVLGELRPDSDVPAAAAAAIAQFHRLIEEYQRRFAGAGLATTLRGLIEQIGYEQELERTCRDPNERLARWNAVQEVVNAVADYEAQTRQPTLRGFLDEMTLDPRIEPDKHSQLRGDAVTLMTLHSAKGLEFPQVYMVGLEEGILPHHRSVEGVGSLFRAAGDVPRNADGTLPHEKDSRPLSSVEEERRLCYVGMTRARDRLTLTLPLSRRKWGKARPTQPSRFLYEMTGQAERIARGGRKAGAPVKRRAVRAQRG